MKKQQNGLNLCRFSELTLAAAPERICMAHGHCGERPCSSQPAPCLCEASSPSGCCRPARSPWSPRCSAALGRPARGPCWPDWNGSRRSVEVFYSIKITRQDWSGCKNNCLTSIRQERFRGWKRKGSPSIKHWDSSVKPRLHCKSSITDQNMGLRQDYRLSALYLHHFPIDETMGG